MDSCCPGLHEDIDVAKRFKVSLRVVRDRARARQIGHKFGRVSRWFTESEIRTDECRPSYSSRGKALRTAMCSARLVQ